MELADMSQADKSLDLQLARRRPRKASDVVPVHRLQAQGPGKASIPVQRQAGRILPSLGEGQSLYSIQTFD